MLLQNIKTAFSSILSNKLRAFLTMLGVIIGVAAVLLMLAVGDGVKNQVSDQISSLGSNILTVTSGQILKSSNGSSPRATSFNPASSFGASTLTEKDVETAKNNPNIALVSPYMLVSSLVNYQTLSTSSAMIVATNQDYAKIRNLKFSQGGFFNKQDSDDASNVAVMGPVTKENLFGDQNAIDKEISIRNQKFRVIGVVETSDSGTSSFSSTSDDVVYIPSESAAKLTNSKQIFRILSQVNDARNIDSTKAELEREIKKNHSDQQDFSVLTQKELLSTFSYILDLLTSFIVAIASISLVVGGIGIMNIMLVSVSERTREIGIRKAIGATNGNILGQFIVESILVSLVGGMLGLVVSYMAGLVIKKVVNITPIYNLKAVMVAFGISVTVGIIFGVAPALKAARKKPITALKSL